MYVELYEHQKRFLAKDLDKCMLVWATGGMKTRASIEWAKKKGGKTLVICPKGLKKNWGIEIEKWNGDKALFTIISKEEFKKIQPLAGNVIVDECDHFASAQFKSQLSKTLRDYIKKNNPRLCFCSATPLRSSPWNIFSLGCMLGKLDAKRDYKNFEDTFFTPRFFGSRRVMVPRVSEVTKENMRTLIAKIGDVVTEDMVTDVPEQTDLTVHFEVDAQQKKVAKDCIEISPIAVFTALHRAASLNTDKIAYCLRVANENEKVVIVVRYRETLEHLKTLLKAEFHTVYELHGGIEDRQGVVEAVEQVERCVILVQSSTVEGYSLNSCRTMVFESMDYSYRNYLQVRGRILRLNDPHPNTYVTLISGEEDKAIYDAMKNKLDFDPIQWAKKKFDR
jgi:superfamily II DNA or RNA helicase